MAAIRPFAALRPRPEAAPRICELPYDVVSSEEARALAAGNRESFFYVSKPEIDLPAGIDHYDPRVYAKGRDEFQRLIAQGGLQSDPEPCFYLYRQVMGRHAQVGLVAVASCEDYLNNIIKKHELTRPEKEDDRVRHIEALNAQTGPAFLVYRAVPELDALVARRIAEAPAIDFTSKDGVRHSSWIISQREDIERIQARFAQMPALYIADGHHRSAAAARICRTRKGAGDSAWFLAVIFPHNQIQILPYNRVLKDLNGQSPERLLKKLAGIFHVNDSTSPAPVRKHELGFYLEGRWRTLSFRPEYLAAKDPIETLDATLLQKLVLEPVFGIDNPRTSQRVNFVGGIRGIGELERLVDRGDYACALALYPTSIDDLMSVANAGGIMPPKSTWFEPKLRDGMFCHLIC
jgi:uncharacterized protein (DUF1015 family)